MIDVGISDHQLIYCTRKIKRIKYNMHNQIQVQSLRNYITEIFINALKTVHFPNYKIFLNVNVAYSDRLNKISDTIDNVAPIKEIRIKNNPLTNIFLKTKDDVTNFDDKKNVNIFKKNFFHTS